MLLTCAFVWADPVSDAQKLKEEALAILKANANATATPEEYATCILKLEKARDILEAAGNNSALAQEVGSTLFWARRFSDVHVIAALEKMGGINKTPETAKPLKTVAQDPAEPTPVLTLARKAYSEAESFTREHAGDDYMIALTWFQMASEHPGTDYALKALAQARAAQARFSAKSAAQENLSDNPEMKLVKQGDERANSDKYDESAALYQASLKLKETVVAHRRLATAYFKRAQQMKDEINPKLEAAETAISAAAKDAYTSFRTLGGGTIRRFNPRYPPLLDAQRKQADLHKEGRLAIDYFNRAESEFKAVLRLSPNEKDLDAAGHIALCWMARDDASIRAQARQQVLRFLGEYKPGNDMERSLYEFCKAAADAMR